MTAIAPSILAADFSRLGALVQEVEQGGANRIHIDVMDGHFVPNLSMGPVVVKGLRPVTRLPLEVHLMVNEPGKFIEPFLNAGADTLIVHHEVLADARQLIDIVHGKGKRIGIALNPGTPVEKIEPYLERIDLVLCMTVWPGFGGQAYLPESTERIKQLRNLIDRRGYRCELEVDGGIDMTTAPISAGAGANVFVAGTSIFGAAAGARTAVQNMMRLVCA